MPPEISKLVYDMLAAAQRVQTFTAKKAFEDYCNDDMLRSAVERQFEIIGEAMTRLVKLNEDVASRITDYRKISGFRNVLIHGCDAVDETICWGIVQTKLPALIAELQQMLSESTRK